MEALLILGPPDLDDPAFVRSLTAAFAVNWKNVSVYAVSFALLSALAIKAASWITLGFSDWQRFTGGGWGLVAILAATTLIPILGFIREELPHFAYGQPPDSFARLRAVPAKITGRGWAVSTVAQGGNRRLYWRIPDGPLTGATPVIPSHLAKTIPDGSIVWLGIDPSGKAAPLVLGFQVTR